MTRKNDIEIFTGYRDELIGAVAAMHSRIYSKIAGFGAHFEAMVATNFANFINRLEFEGNQTWYAEHKGRIVASISIDGQAAGENTGCLKWFVVEPEVQSEGLGGELMQLAMDFCEEQKFSEVHLDTFEGLDAARRLYERHGFKLTEERLGRNYGQEVMQQKFVKIFDGSNSDSG